MSGVAPNRAVPPPRVAQAVLLVGGKGTRLGDLTRTTPKPLMPIGEERVFLDLLVENVARQGFRRISLLAGFHGDQIAARYHGRRIQNADIEVLIEPEPLGTAGALQFASAHLDEWFVLANGDTYFDIGYRALEAVRAGDPGLDGALALRAVEDAARYGSVDLDGTRIMAFNEKSPERAARPGLINGGVYLLSRRILGLVPAGRAASLETEVFPLLAGQGRLAGLPLSGYFIDIGLPETLAQARLDLPARMSRPALFLDRDGVLNIDHGYVHQWSDFDWLDGVGETIRAFNDAGWFVFVVTNQAGVAHGYYDEVAVMTLHETVADALAQKGAHIDAFYHCPYHPNGIVACYRADHEDRKPRPGMITRALTEWPVDVARSFLVGDKDSDVAAARAAGIEGLLFDDSDLYRFLQARQRLPSLT